MKKYINKITIIIGVLSIACIILGGLLIVSNNKQKKLQDEIREKTNQIETIDTELIKIKEENTTIKNQYDEKVRLTETLQEKIDNDSNKQDSSNKVTQSNNNSVNNENKIVSEKDKMVVEGRKYFADRGVKVSLSGYSEMVGTNLNSGISELEGHRVFAFTIVNYDIKDNNIWFYYSPETKIGYKYEKEKWTKI